MKFLSRFAIFGLGVITGWILFIGSHKIVQSTNGPLNDVKIEEEVTSVDSSKADVEFFEGGVRFYKKINFYCGEGELSSIASVNGAEIIPAGVSLLVAKKDYLIGRFEGDIAF